MKLLAGSKVWQRVGLVFAFYILTLSGAARALENCAVIAKDLLEHERAVTPKKHAPSNSRSKEFDRMVAERVARARAAMDKNFDWDLSYLPAETLPSQYRDLINDVNKAMHDPERFVVWLGGFIREVGNEMATSKDPAVIKAIHQGRIHPKFVIRVIKKRAHKAGLKLKRLDRQLNSDEFYDLIKEGYIFWDYAFKGKQHGRDPHIFQILYIDEVTMGRGRELMKSAAEASEANVWGKLLDSGQQNLTSPEYISELLHEPLGADWSSAPF